jgi:hypothetical protein
MNDKKKNSSSSTNVDLGDLDKLENELNELSSTANNNYSKTDSTTKTMSGLGGFGSAFSSFFGATPEPTNSLKVDDESDGIVHSGEGGIGFDACFCIAWRGGHVLG